MPRQLHARLPLLLLLGTSLLLVALVTMLFPSGQSVEDSDSDELAQDAVQELQRELNAYQEALRTLQSEYNDKV